MSAHPTAGGDLVFVGDVHLDRDDAHLGPFLELLDRLARSASHLVLLGDLFNVWLGRPELEQPHHTAVIERLCALRRRGLVVDYLEGNRDFQIASHYVGRAFDRSSDRGLVERFAGLSLYAAHGDRINRADRRYRLWRRASRSPVSWALFNLLPRARRRRVAEAIEARLRSTNLEFKRAFPEDEVRRYAAEVLSAGHDVLVLGHFHVERDFRSLQPPGRIVVVPEWKGSRRHLRVTSAGDIRFVDSAS